MRTVLRHSLGPIAAACAAVLLAGCGGGGGGSSTPSVTTLSLTSKVVNSTSGNPVSGATVTLTPGNLTATTDGTGTYLIDGVPATFTSGTVTVTAPSFADDTEAVTLVSSGFVVNNSALTPAGTTVSITPATGTGTTPISQPVAADPTLPPVVLSVPAGALSGSSAVGVTATPLVTLPDDGLVDGGVTVLKVGDTVNHRPEIRVQITPEMTLNSPATISLPLPFPMTPGASVPFMQKKNGAWTEVGTATVDSSGNSATATITEFLPTGVEAWHSITGSKTQLPDVTLTEASLASINNNLDNLPDRDYVITKTVTAGTVALIAARFKATFTVQNVNSNEDNLIEGPVGRRVERLDSLSRGPWNMSPGTVKYKVFQLTGTIQRMLAGQPVGSAGSVTITRGVPNWPLPGIHNQGGVQ